MNEAAPEGRAEDAGPTAIEFRTLTHKHRRRAFKLERLFWRILEGAAAAQKTSLAEFAANTVEGREGNGNRTSMLRVAAAQWLMSRLLDLSEKSLSPKMLSSLVRASPSPTFIVNTHHAIETPNEAFMRLLEGLRGPQEMPGSDAISIRFRTDVASLVQRCRSSGAGFVTDELVLSAGSRTQVLKARIAAIETLSARPMGFLVYIMGEGEGRGA